MKKLTFDGNFCDIAQCRELPCRYDGNCSQKQVWERLKAYEDTGMMPEEVERSKLEIEAGCVKAIARTYGIDINRLRKLASADRDGRIVVLPCKVGGYGVAHCPGRRTTHHTGRSTRYVLRGRYDAVRRAGQRESRLYREIRKNCIFEPRGSREGFAGNGGQEGWLN